ncbi:MAG: glutamine--tRNA ligase/YqeY domain fusion protein [Fastidiosipilaceae bacterium]|jgi:glutaminyl-tRNA synthetase|nr:glutamine--tRNA ligase/YqeY domain fusion protein [Clostridiaceae bacterium]
MSKEINDKGLVNEAEETQSRHFIQNFIDEDIAPGGDYAGMTVHTRFPPEPNGFLHIGHAKAICINFGLAEEYNGLCNLRMDDTNPVSEDKKYVDAIQEDIHWLGFDWGDRFYFASDYFPKMYEYACDLIRKGLAYVCDLTPEEIRETRGTLTEPGQNSPYRDRSPEENLDLFERMKNGEFPDGSRTLRAKIDMTSGNMNMRDPVIYRISHNTHHRTGDDWCIYPMYDFAHPIEDGLEHITHSLCSIEFEDHRPLYDWVVEHCDLPSTPRQIEFARLGMNYTVMSKRKLLQLVESGTVDGWDDPRMPTLRGLRRRGYTPESIRNFVQRVGVSKVPNTVDHAFLEFCIREDLNERADRRMAVLEPIPLTITNYPDDQTEFLTADNHPQRDDTREISFSKHLWIDADDFMIDPPRKYFRMFPGNEVRLKHAYIVRCTGYDVDDDGHVTHVYAEYDPDSRGGNAPDGRKVRGTIHWVDQNTAYEVDINLYEYLFTVEDPDNAEGGYDSVINENSLRQLKGCKLEACMVDAPVGTSYQFIRKGYFCKDNKADSDAPVFNRTVSLRDSFKLPKK